MFDRNDKYAEELVFCDKIEEDETGKTYYFENGQTIHLGKEYKICSDLIDRKVIVEKDGNYGVVIIYSDKIIDSLQHEIQNINWHFDYLVDNEMEKHPSVKEMDEEISEIKTKFEKAETLLNTPLDQIDYSKSLVEDAEKYLQRSEECVVNIDDIIKRLTEFYEKYYKKTVPVDIDQVEESPFSDKLAQYNVDYNIKFLNEELRSDFFFTQIEEYNNSGKEPDFYFNKHILSHIRRLYKVKKVLPDQYKQKSEELVREALKNKYVKIVEKYYDNLLDIKYNGSIVKARTDKKYPSLPSWSSGQEFYHSLYLVGDSYKELYCENEYTTRVDVELADIIIKLYIEEAKKSIVELSDKKQKTIEEINKAVGIIEEQRKSEIDKVNQKLSIGFSLIEPQYKKVNLGNGYLYASDQDFVYVFDSKGQIKEEISKTVIRNINDDTFYDERGKLYHKGVIYDEVKMEEKAGLIYFFARRYHDEVSMGKKFANVYVYSSDGKLLSEQSVVASKEVYQIYHMSATSEMNNIVYGSSYLNLVTGKKVQYEGISDYRNGHALVSENGKIIVVDTDFNATRECNFRLVKRIDIDKEYKGTFDFEYDNGYMPIYMYKKGLFGKSVEDNGKNKKVYGYCNSNGDIVVNCKYSSYEEAKAALEKYIQKQEKKGTKTNSIEEKPVEKNEVLSKNDELYELENIIKSYLSKMEIRDLDLKLRIMQKEYFMDIRDKAKEDLEKRKLILGKTPSLQLGDASSSNSAYNAYKARLKDFIKQIETNKHFVDILSTINTVNKLLDGENVELNDDLFQDLKTLNDLYSNLNPAIRDASVERLRKILSDEKEYIVNYLFRKDYDEKCKYSSFGDWEKSLRMQMQGLLQEFKADYETQAIMSKKSVIEEARNVIDITQYESRNRETLMLSKEITKIVKGILAKTKDPEILEGLQAFKYSMYNPNISIDENIRYLINPNKTAEENYRDMETLFKEAVKYEKTVNDIIMPEEEYGNYNYR